MLTEMSLASPRSPSLNFLWEEFLEVLVGGRLRRPRTQHTLVPQPQTAPYRASGSPYAARAAAMRLRWRRAAGWDPRLTRSCLAAALVVYDVVRVQGGVVRLGRGRGVVHLVYH